MSRAEHHRREHVAALGAAKVRRLGGIAVTSLVAGELAALPLSRSPSRWRPHKGLAIAPTARALECFHAQIALLAAVPGASLLAPLSCVLAVGQRQRPRVRALLADSARFSRDHALLLDSLGPSAASADCSVAAAAGGAAAVAALGAASAVAEWTEREQARSGESELAAPRALILCWNEDEARALQRHLGARASDLVAVAALPRIAMAIRSVLMRIPAVASAAPGEAALEPRSLLATAVESGTALSGSWLGRLNELADLAAAQPTIDAQSLLVALSVRALQLADAEQVRRIADAQSLSGPRIGASGSEVSIPDPQTWLAMPRALASSGEELEAPLVRELRIFLSGELAPYWSLDAVGRGAAKGLVVRGRLMVEEMPPEAGLLDAPSQAFVRLPSARTPVVLAAKEAFPSENVDRVLLQGRAAMGRAIHGDSVAVLVLPRCLWTQLFPTGLVVAVLQRTTSEVVATVVAPSSPAAAAASALLDAAASDAADELTSSADPSMEDAVANDEPEAALRERDACVLIPCSKQLPPMRLRQMSTTAATRLAGQRVTVRVDDWPLGSRMPTATLVRSLGMAGQLRTEVESLFVNYGLRLDPFSPAALACLPSVPSPPLEEGSDDKRRWHDSRWLPAEGDRGGGPCSQRWDVRASRRVFSVDPIGCQDIDDAMSVQQRPNGNLEVGVHIADVDSFVSNGSALDLEARQRGTTIYLSHARFDMLPVLLSSDVCSLHGRKERRAMSVFWELTAPPMCEVVSVRSSVAESEFCSASNHSDGPFVPQPHLFAHAASLGDCFVPSVWAGRTLIKSVAALTYEQAHRLLEGLSPDPEGAEPPPPGQAGAHVPRELWAPLRADLLLLREVSRALRRKRAANGALDLSSSGGELKFSTTAEGEPTDVRGREELEIHHTIEELMILANSTVATIILQRFPSEALLRNSPVPDPARFIPLRRIESALRGGQLGPDAPSVFTNKDVQALLLGSRDLDADSRELLSSLASRAMTEALYVSSGDPDLAVSALAAGTAGGAISEAILAILRNTQAFLIEPKRARELHSALGAGAVLPDRVSFSTFPDAVASRLFAPTPDLGRLLHFGLGLLEYTHFTSPIRRYADVVVHRQLAAAVALAVGRAAPLAVSSAVDAHSAADEILAADNVAAPAESVCFVDDVFGSLAVASQPQLADHSFASTSLEDLLDDLLLQEPPASAAAPPSVEAEFDALIGATPTASLEAAPVAPAATPAKVVVAAPSAASTRQDRPFGAGEVRRISQHLNKKHRNAKFAAIECQSLFLTLFLQRRHARERCSAVIISTSGKACRLFIPRYDMQREVRLLNNAGLLCCPPHWLGLPDEFGSPLGTSDAPWFGDHARVLGAPDIRLSGSDSATLSVASSASFRVAVGQSVTVLLRVVQAPFSLRPPELFAVLDGLHSDDGDVHHFTLVSEEREELISVAQPSLASSRDPARSKRSLTAAVGAAASAAAEPGSTALRARGFRLQLPPGMAWQAFSAVPASAAAPASVSKKARPSLVLVRGVPAHVLVNVEALERADSDGSQSTTSGDGVPTSRYSSSSMLRAALIRAAAGQTSSVGSLELTTMGNDAMAADVARWWSAEDDLLPVDPSLSGGAEAFTADSAEVRRLTQQALVRQRQLIKEKRRYKKFG